MLSFHQNPLMLIASNYSTQAPQNASLPRAMNGFRPLSLFGLRLTADARQGQFRYSISVNPVLLDVELVVGLPVGDLIVLKSLSSKKMRLYTIY